MYKLRKKSECFIKDSSVYMEIYNEKKLVYRVISATLLFENNTGIVYGVEIEDFKTGEKENIYDFSDNVEKAVAFAETLIKNKNKPDELYNVALNYLGTYFSFSK